MKPIKAISFNQEQAEWLHINVTKMARASYSLPFREVLDSIGKKIKVDIPVNFVYAEIRTVSRIIEDMLSSSKSIKKIYEERVNAGRKNTKVYLIRIRARIKMLTALQKRVNKCF